MEFFNSKNCIGGISIIETMIVVSIVAVLAAIGIPQITEFFQLRRLVSTTNELKTAVSYGRSEAIRRNLTVHLSPLGSNPQNNWGDGWRLWVDQNNNNNFDNNVDELLLVKAGLPPRINAHSTGGTTKIEFSGSGFIKNFVPNSSNNQFINIQLTSGSCIEALSIQRNALTTINTVARNNCAQ